MLRNLISLRAKRAAQRLKKSLESLSEALANNANNTPSHSPVPVPIPVRNSRKGAPVGSNPFNRMTGTRSLSMLALQRTSMRNYSSNPFNPFHQVGYFFRLTRSFGFKVNHISRFNPFNPFNPLNRYKFFNVFKIMLQFKHQPMISLRANSRMANCIWNFSAFRCHSASTSSRFFIFSGLYRAFPQTQGRLFTTYACGGPIPGFGFSAQITTETIKNLAISFRTLFNLDKSTYKPLKASENKFHPYLNEKPTDELYPNSHIKSDIRLNLSLTPKHAQTTMAIGGEEYLDDDDDEVHVIIDEDEDEYLSSPTDTHHQLVNGCCVDFPLGGNLSIPSMTFLTEEILGEINANLTYINRRINELKQDFMNLSELGELPIKYLPQENVLRVYFPNCDRDKLETLLREKNIMGGIIREQGDSSNNTPQSTTFNTNVEQDSNTHKCAPPPPPPLVSHNSEITENDLLSSLYQSNGSSSQSSEDSSVLYEDDVLSSYGSSRSHHPLSDAEVIRINDMGIIPPMVSSGPIAISDSSGGYYWVDRN
ncbi:hypothetical protein CAAN1_19S02476 [[Candida] anglica]|uniref:Uncharacterized protein n=1 Tax=[Candida] anglica TaxID=148631 RepID=A0ABP0E5V4_9ASCO